MENKEMKKNTPVELEDEMLDTVSGGASAEVIEIIMPEIPADQMPVGAIVEC